MKDSREMKRIKEVNPHPFYYGLDSLCPYPCVQIHATGTTNRKCKVHENINEDS